MKANQPAWSSPLVTTTGMLEQRFRFDASERRAGNGADTKVADGGKGLDLIVSNSNEVQIAAPPYELRDAPSGKVAFTGFDDWAFFAGKAAAGEQPGKRRQLLRHRVASSPSAERHRAFDYRRLDLSADIRVRQRLGRF